MWFIGVEVEQETSAPPPASHASWSVDERVTATRECLTPMIWTVACERVVDLKNQESFNF